MGYEEILGLLGGQMFTPPEMIMWCRRSVRKI